MEGTHAQEIPQCIWALTPQHSFPLPPTTRILWGLEFGHTRAQIKSLNVKVTNSSAVLMCVSICLHKVPILN
jgi:hypothetical protein